MTDIPKPATVVQLLPAPEERGERVIPLLRQLLAEAEAGDVATLAVAVVRPGGRTMWTWTGADSDQVERLLFPLLDLTDLVRETVRDDACTVREVDE